MRSLLRRAAVLALVPCLGAVAGATGASAATQPTETGASVTKTRVCVIKKTKRARVVRTTEKCVRGETRMTWKHYEAYASDASTDSGASSSDEVVGPAGPQGLTGETGATGARGPSGSNGAAGATGAPGATGATGATGETGARGALGPAGPSDVYTTTGGARSVQSTSEETRATLTLPAGSYLLLGQADVFSASGTGQYFVTCRLRDRGAPLTAVDGNIDDVTNDGTNVHPDQANLVLTAPLVTSGGTVTLTCQGFLGLPLVGDVQLTAIQTGALHVQ
jgi:hypothetical protein